MARFHTAIKGAPIRFVIVPLKISVFPRYRFESSEGTCGRATPGRLLTSRMQRGGYGPVFYEHREAGKQNAIHVRIMREYECHTLFGHLSRP